MAENSKIEWTDHTFNPWWGCVEVSPACDNCYAKELDSRYNAGKVNWGKDAPRKPMSESYWNQPMKWDRAAKAEGVIKKVFCASMADVFETHDSRVVIAGRDRLWKVIEATPYLDWLLLTKRPQNMTREGFVPDSWRVKHWPSNVVAMTTVENQQWADVRIPQLIQVPALRRGLSMEPLVGPVDLSKWIGVCYDCDEMIDHHRGGFQGYGDDHEDYPEIHWVITGGESGKNARPADPDWYRSLRDQCTEANVKFHFKQWGEWVPLDQSKECSQARENGNNPGFWNFECASCLQQQAAGTVYIDRTDCKCKSVYRFGKKKAGRALDGRTWDGYIKRGT